MKKQATILMLVDAILVGGMTMEAKTTGKKGKTRSAQSSSAQWNGDIPSAKIIEQFFMTGSDAQTSKYRSQFINHGYHFKDYEDIAIKEGVYKIETQRYAQTIDVNIKISDSTQRQWLYNDMQALVKSKGKRSGLFVSMDGNEIIFSLSRYN